jgi:hypothetical protein
MTEVIGQSKNGRGVYGESESGQGVWGFSQSDTGVVGENGASGAGVIGKSTNGRGVYGESGSGQGLWGFSQSDTGVVGESGGSGSGVIGKSANGRGVYGESGSGQGVWGFSQSDSGVVGVSETGVGVFGKGGRVAGHFEGDVEVTGKIGGTHCSFNGDVAVTGNVTVDRDITLTNADCAEDFDIASPGTAEPGTVMVLDSKGMLKPSDCAYDKHVAGVISGAGDYKPGIVLDKQHRRRDRSPVALLGKVFCKVDASDAAIEIGDLLTTSGTPGHAMKATDPIKAFGTVIGKALGHCERGRGLIPILVALQ